MGLLGPKCVKPKKGKSPSSSGKEAHGIIDGGCKGWRKESSDAGFTIPL